MVSFGALVSLVLLGVWIYALFDALTADTAKVRTLQKPMWVVIVLLIVPFVPIGAVAWFLWGRPRVSDAGGGSTGGFGGFGGGGNPFGGGQWGGGGGGSRPTRQPRGSSSGSRPRPRPIAPDDDPDFLKSL